MRATRLSIRLLMTLATACGDDSSAKDAGTDFDAAPDSDAPTTVASPAGGTFRELPEVTMTASESATIYYTVDGSDPTTSSTSGPSPVTVAGLSVDNPLRFFAVDDAGNAETAKQELYAVDRFGPVPVENFRASVDADDITLTWTNPAADDFAEVVIAAVPDVTATPVPAVGTSLAEGDALSSGGAIVFVGSAETVVLADQPVGNYSYVGWARYNSGEFSDGRAAAAGVLATPAPGQITIDVAALTVTVNTQPAGYTLAGDTVVFDAGTLTFNLAATSNLPGIHFNTKLAIASLTGGALDNGDGTISDGGALNGNPFRYYGPEGLLDQQTASRSLAFSAVAADGTVVLSVDMQNDRAVFMPSWEQDSQPNGLGVFDIANAFSIYGGARPPTFDNVTRPSDYGAFRGGAITADARFVYFGARNMPRVSKLDLSTMDIVAGVDIALTQEAGAVTDLWMGAVGQRLWALINDGMHSGSSQDLVADYESRIDRTLPPSNTIVLVEIDATSLVEVGRVTIGTSTDIRYRGRRMSISADGRWAAIAAGASYAVPSISEMFLVDLTLRELVDADDVTDGVQSFDVQGLRPSQPAFTLDGSSIVFNNSYEDGCDKIGLIDVATKVVTIHDYDPIGDCDFKAMNFIPLADGTVQLVGQYDGLVTFNPADGTFTTVGTESYYHLWGIRSEDGSRYVGSDYGDMQVITTADGLVERTTNSVTNSLYGHHPLVTPF